MQMKLKDRLSERKEFILEKWFERIINAYPADTARFLKDQKDRFANPVGATITRGLEGILEEILKDEQEQDRAAEFIDNIIRIRAVQNFSPSQAVSFVFLLKTIIRDELSGDILRRYHAEEVLALESQIDSLALVAFDIYMSCREKIYEIKSNEARDMTFRLLQRANLLQEKPNRATDNINDVRTE